MRIRFGLPQSQTLDLIVGKCIVCGSNMAMQVEASFSSDPELETWCCMNKKCASSWNVKDGEVEMNSFETEEGFLLVWNEQEQT